MGPFDRIAAEIAHIRVRTRHGRIVAVGPGSVEVEGMGAAARAGDRVGLGRRGSAGGEVVALERARIRVMPYGPPDGLSIGQAVGLDPEAGLRPHDGWRGRIVDAFGEPLDGQPLVPGKIPQPLKSTPPPAAARRPLGARMATGVAALDTMLPVVRGQRIGIFAGSGVGKSTLLAEIARRAAADVVVLGLVGERGRELGHFVSDVLGPEGLARSVIVTATADQSPLIKRRAAWSAMAVAEHFRDQGAHVLILLDSLTRMAEAHREVALTAGEPASLRAFPPSTPGLIAGLAERAGPGAKGQGDITAVFTVLVAGSDMDEPVADMARGVLDGHIVLEREIAERGRFPAIDVRRSVSRALPDAASQEENDLIREARRILGAYEAAAPMIQAGLYTHGADPSLDRAIQIWPRLDALFGQTGLPDIPTAFQALRAALTR